MEPLKPGSTGREVRDLQHRLIDKGFAVKPDGWFGEQTEQAVKDFQRKSGVVVDGIAGPKTLYALMYWKKPLHLGEADLEAAAARLGVELAAIKAVNEVESTGEGFFANGKAKILFERHVMHRRLEAAGIDADALAAKYPQLINEKRGGYAGGVSELIRQRDAAEVSQRPDVAIEAASYGAYQIMGFHWKHLGYASAEAFAEAMNAGEAEQLDAFVRFIEAEAGIHKALKAKKWADFAKGYNGPAYKDNLYDVKLARAYERHAAQEKVVA